MSFGAKPVRTVYLPAPPVAQTPAEMQTEADKAAEEVKKKARKAGSGRQSTILTSPLGVVSPAPVQVKTLLGQ